MRSFTTLLAATFALLSASAQAQPEPPADDAQIVGPGHSAYWYVPARDGAGWSLEILDEATALLYWFTYDEQGNQRWLTGVGAIERTDEGAWIEFPELIETTGGRFGSAFEADEINHEVVGQATMWFGDCDQGGFRYQAYGQQQTFAIQRLTRTMGVACRTPIHGRPFEPVTGDAGLSGSWYNPEQAGHGITLQWLSRDEALLTWYTFDASGNPLWLLGVGRREGDEIVFGELTVSTGGRFGEAFDPDQVNREVWGMLALELDCATGALAWDGAESGSGTGMLDLERLTGLARPGCPVEQTELTDLYSLELTEVPVPVLGIIPGEPTPDYHAAALAPDGTVAGFDTLDRGWIWRPGEASIEQLEGEVIEFRKMLWRRDANELVAVQEFATQDGGERRIAPIRWVSEQGWQELEGFNLDTSVTFGSSKNGKYLTGDGILEDRPWLWDSENGQRLLNLSPSDDPNFEGLGEAVSNDGRIVVGTQVDFPGSGNFPRERATRWVDGEPQFMRDPYGAVLRWAFDCNTDCSIILGGDQGAEVAPDHPHVDQAWAWSESQGTVYFGELSDAVDWPYQVSHASADASLAIGSYQAPGTDNFPKVRAFVWTPRSGIVSVTDLLAELGLPESRWNEVRTADLSADGRKLLFTTSEPRSTEQYSGVDWRVWTIELTPKRQPHE